METKLKKINKRLKHIEEIKQRLAKGETLNSEDKSKIESEEKYLKLLQKVQKKLSKLKL